MPYKVDKRGSQYCVIKSDTGETMKCYDDKAAADKYNAALNIAHAKSKGYLEEPLSEEIKQELREWEPGS